MSKPSLYQITSREVEPLTEVMKSIVELNWNLIRARDAGWAVELTIHEDAMDVDVTVSRNEWPRPDDEDDQ